MTSTFLPTASGRIFKANAAPMGTQATGKRKKPVPLSHELGGRHGEETKESGEGRKKGRQKE
jgi:hypothetical protein